MNKGTKKTKKAKTPPKGTLKITAFFAKSPSKPNSSRNTQNVGQRLNDEPIIIDDDSSDEVKNIFVDLTNSTSSPIKCNGHAVSLENLKTNSGNMCHTNSLVAALGESTSDTVCNRNSMKGSNVLNPLVKTPNKVYGKRKPGTKCNENEFMFERSPLKEDLKKSRQFPSEAANCSKDLFDSFSDDIWDDINIVPEYTLDIQNWTHCQILDIAISLNSKTVIVKATKSDEKTAVTLLGSWKECKMDVGASVYIQAKCTPNYVTPFCLDNDYGFLVYEPEILVSGTSVVNALFCPRRAVLGTNIRSSDTSGANLMLIGSMVHTLLQISLRDKLCTEKQIHDLIETVFSTRNVIFELYANDMSLEKTKTELQQFVPKIVRFMKEHVKSSVPLPTSGFSNRSKLMIDAIEDIEENIWCHKLGIKGKVDVSVRSGGGGATLPLEVKTGRASGSLEHRGQVMLYTMMMRQLGYNTPSGILLYLRENVVQEVSCNYREERDLILLRNDLVYFLQKQSNFAVKPARIHKSSETEAEDRTHRTLPADEQDQLIAELETLEEEFEALTLLPPELPDPINHHSACAKCSQNVICCALLKKEIAADNPLKKVKQEQLAHLKASHIRYFTNWYSMIYLEEEFRQKRGKDIREIYTLLPEERAKKGRSLINMRLNSQVIKSSEDWIHKFEKCEASTSDILKCGISDGGYLVVSTNTRPAVAAGFVTHIDSESISVSLERNLLDKYRKCPSFHLDTYEGSNTLAFNLSSVALLLENNERAQRLREIVIERKQPTYLQTLPTKILKHGRKILKSLNKVQCFAVLKALSAYNYLLIKGMPGTGKTQMIVCLIQMLVALKRSVLITSHTHSAVDNVCLRLEKVGIEIVRLGALSRTDPRLLHRSEHTLTKDFTKPEQFEEFYNNACVLAVTCMGSNHVALSKRTLDVCIVDESTQVLQSSVIRPLLACKTFFLVGDPDQLPPVVKNSDAIKLGMNVSLFALLNSPVSTVTLTHQYRMNKSITDLANVLTYGGQLLTANDDVAKKVLKLDEPFKNLSPSEKWMRRIFDCDLKAAVTLIDTGSVWKRNDKISILPPMLTEKEQGICFNFHEAVVINSVVAKLLNAGVEFDSIGIIATYRAQVDLLLTVLPPEVEISTVDQYQGRDKDVIIYSCTKSVSTSSERSAVNRFDILEDQKRLTVAITRAKVKLILVGDVTCLNSYTPFMKLFQGIVEENVIRLKDESAFNWTDILNSLP